VSYEHLLLEIHGPLAQLKLNRPDSLNSMNTLTIHEILRALEQCNQAEEVRVVIISGEGRGFSSGGDIQFMIRNGVEQAPAVVAELAAEFAKIGRSIRALEKPVIASLKGAVAGAGCNLALNCDFRIAAKNCKFVQSFVQVGLVPDLGGVFILSKLLGIARATELSMTGQVLNAQEAYDYGLITKLVEVEDLEKETLAFAQQLTQLPIESLRGTKKLINFCEFQNYDAYLAEETKFQILCAQSDNSKEGIQAFLEKRPPQFR